MGDTTVNLKVSVAFPLFTSVAVTVMTVTPARRVVNHQLLCHLVDFNSGEVFPGGRSGVGQVLTLEKTGKVQASGLPTPQDRLVGYVDCRGRAGCRLDVHQEAEGSAGMTDNHALGISDIGG